MQNLQNLQKPKFGKTDSLALEWCKFFSKMVYDYFGDDFDPIEVSSFFSADMSVDKMAEMIRKYPTMLPLLRSSGNLPQAMQDFDCILTMMSWGKNKQTYTFDKDFTDELMKTDNLRFTKDMFDFVPHKFMYIDISDNKDLCDKLLCKGFFVKIDKVPKSLNKIIVKGTNASEKLRDCDKWCFHICRISEDEYGYNMLYLPNTDESIEAKDLIKESKIKYSKNNNEYEFDVELLHKVVQHTVTYLTSTDPDIRESQLTQRTYREPSKTIKRPKDKFSEVRNWEVGVRYGNAYRKWKSKEEMNHSSVSTGTGKKVRPHSRRAHYNYYWYGKRDSADRVLKRVWIDELFINVDKDKTEELPVVIHKVKKSKPPIERD